ncbi:MAG TPA: hypothetical protein VE616_24435 [Candidatus Udaeobacter sp.]|jgi:hypothetical protein|nr:hypothetical protein [Candidatus Udaeobacter sp.]
MPATAQLFNVTKAPFDPANPGSVIVTAVSLLFYSIFNDPIAKTGGIPYDNGSTQYVGSANDPKLNAEVERVESDGRARAYARRFYQPNGALHAPLVTLHNTLDPVVPFQHEVTYSNLVAQRRKSAFLNILPVARYGHCNFTTQEVVEAFALTVQQAEAQLVN